MVRVWKSLGWTSESENWVLSWLPIIWQLDRCNGQGLQVEPEVVKVSEFVELILLNKWVCLFALYQLFVYNLEIISILFVCYVPHAWKLGIERPSSFCLVWTFLIWKSTISIRKLPDKFSHLSYAKHALGNKSVW